MLHDHANADTLGMLRVLVFGMAAVSRLWDTVCDAHYLPDYLAVDVMRLVGAPYWVPGIPIPVALGMQALTIGLCLAVALGIGRYRRWAVLACIALVVTEGMVRGRAPIPHRNTILILLGCLLCAFPAADALTVPRRRNRSSSDPTLARAAMVSSSLLFLSTYTLAAARRFVSGGLGVYLDDSILVSTVMRDVELGAAGGAGVWASESIWMGWALRIGFPVITLLEFLSPLCLFSRRFRWIWAAGMIPFHLGVALLMGIWFPYNLVLIPVLVLGVDPFRFRRPRERPVEEEPLPQPAG